MLDVRHREIGKRDVLDQPAFGAVGLEADTVLRAGERAVVNGHAVESGFRAGHGNLHAQGLVHERRVRRQPAIQSNQRRGDPSLQEIRDGYKRSAR